METKSEKNREKNNQQEALGELIVSCQNRISVTLIGLRIPNEAIQDIMQSTWLRVIEEQTEGEQIPGNFEERAQEIARKNAETFLRNREAEKAVLKSEETIQSSPRTPTEIYTSIDQMQGLATILGNLTEREYTCLMMHLDEHTHEEIADKLRISIEIVPGKIERIRDKIESAWLMRMKFETMVLDQIAQYEQSQ